MLEITFSEDAIKLGQRLIVSFHRTLRLPIDGKTYPLPPGFGRFPLVRLDNGCEPGSVVIPMYQREALWIAFTGAEWKPNALKVIVGGVNAVSGVPDDGRVLSEPQDYVVCPDQLWLDGFNAGGGVIQQFVAMPLGEGYAVEASYGVTKEKGGLELIAFEPKPGHFADTPPPKPSGPMRFQTPRVPETETRQMVLGPGGAMRQKIYPDQYGLGVWDLANHGRARVKFINSAEFHELTGQPPPESPIDAGSYTEQGLPWFDIYDEAKGTVEPRREAERLKTISERDAERGIEMTEEDVGQPTVKIIDGSNNRDK